MYGIWVLVVFSANFWTSSFAYGNAGKEINCYECGTGQGPDCVAFSLAHSWTRFQKTCPLNHVCVKAAPAYSDHSQTEHKGGETVRGCAPSQTVSGAYHTMGCSTNQESRILFCNCDTDLCNASPTVHASCVSIISLAVFVTFVLIK